MPRVESATGRLAFAVDLVSRVEAWAGRIGLPREEAAELAMRSSVPPVEQTAIEMLTDFDAGRVQTPEDISKALAAAEIDVPMVAVRLGGKRPVEEGVVEPFQREHVGADLDDDPVTVWSAARGLWRMADRPRVIAAFRLGRPLAIFRVPGWEQDAASGRRWAPVGHILTADGRLDAATGERVADASEVDNTIIEVVTSRLLLLPPAAANPIVWLHGR